MLRNKPSGDRECKIAKVLHQRAQGPLARRQAQVAEGLFGVHPSTVYRLRSRLVTNPNGYFTMFETARTI
jgi:hypothetical protein